jgi:hypothetical protein
MLHGVVVRQNPSFSGFQDFTCTTDHRRGARERLERQVLTKVSVQLSLILTITKQGLSTQPRHLGILRECRVRMFSYIP